MTREKILKELENLIYQAIERAQAVRYGGTPDVNPHKTRQGYYSSIASLINVYSKLYKDLEMDELEKEIQELKELLKEWLI